MTASTIEDGDVDDEVEVETKSRLGLYLFIAALSIIMFSLGTATGVIIDGTAEVVNAFKKGQPDCAMPSITTAVPRPQPTQALEEAAAVAANPFPENNTVEWAISVAPGTPVAPLEIRNSAPTANLLLSFSMPVPGSEPRPVAKLWVRAGELARMSLPVAQYAVALSPYRKDEAYDKAATPPAGVIMPMALRPAIPEQEPAALAISATGKMRYIEPTRKAAQKADPAPKRRRARQTQPEYEGLGREVEAAEQEP